jgi:hypothetical protein
VKAASDTSNSRNNYNHFKIILTLPEQHTGEARRQLQQCIAYKYGFRYIIVNTTQKDEYNNNNNNNNNNNSTRFSITRGLTRRHYRVRAELTLIFCVNINKFNLSAD